MFLYLSKKIAIPNNTKINCLEWNSSQDCVAVGGDDGLLKILKIDSSTPVNGKSKGLAGQANLSINKTLEGHSGNVLAIVWNEKHNKLTSSDENGLIIVWTLYKGTWQEEMINNRNKSIVKGMAWNGDGEKICIVYEDGAVIVGSVEGSRIWGKELKKLMLTGVQWSPNSKFLLFTIKTGEVHLYDSDGNFLSKLSIACLPVSLNNVPIAACHWLNRSDIGNCPQLAIAYKSGHVQLMKDQYDMNPVVFECEMSIVAIKWNHNGSVLALVGSLIVDGDIKESNVLQLYSPFGQHLRTLRIPGFMVSACCWESTSLRITLAIDSFVYFANVRYDYPWCYFANTIVYAYRNYKESLTDVTFWNIKKNEFYHTKFDSLLCMDSYKDHCVLAVQNNNDETKPCSLIICNNINTTVDSKHINFEPIWITMNGTHVIVSSYTSFMTWQYTVPKSHSTSIINVKRKKVKMFHIDDTPSGVDELTQESLEFKSASFQKETKDHITCITASDQYLLIGRESCALQKYSLPQVVLVERKILPTKPYKLALNSNSKRLAVIDSTGVLTLIDNTGDNAVKDSYSPEASNSFQRRDVWTMKWASDDPELLAIMEKTRMYVIRGFNPEEPISTSAYIASFENLEIQAVMLDEIIQSPENPSLDYVVTLETKSLRDTRQLLEKVSIGEAIKFINDNPHPRLSRLLAEASLQALDLATSETAFVQCKDYHGIKFVKQLANIHDILLKQAEVAVYFGDYVKAENLYIEADRKDLAVILHQKLNNWFKVVELLKSSSSLLGISGLTMNLAWQGIGDHFLDNQQWDLAIEYYKKADNPEKLVECYIMVKDYESLASLAKILPKNHPLLETISLFFISSGIVDEEPLNQNISKRILANTRLDTGKLSEQIKNLNNSHRDEWLVNVKDILVTVFKCINSERYIEAAQLIFTTVCQEIKSDIQPNVIKQLATAGALLIEEYKEKNIHTTLSDVDELMIDNYEATPFKSRAEIIENSWRIVESLHFLILAQRQLYNGQFNLALWTSLTLRNYDDLLNGEQIYSIIALAAIANGSFNIASRAFMKLESMDTKNNYNQLALIIFSKYTPEDSMPLSIQCYSCLYNFPAWSLKCPKCKIKPEASIVSGQLLTDIKSVWCCRQCKRNASSTDMEPLNYCPLCRKEVILTF
ncbi:WD40-repeat-containing domain,WD repeat protein 35,WD40/YVTN repeat-like-containing [Cinara cedri]|uniref:WD40-repeat-containing domain,WD repeat protein 35,WD40/YVTN repeat-like-containing n=1 Tax=Cinara cedri TaxID=506608 RepID=A0A5E4N6R4_9HEMI|nr:WD40-repeat-containing domain,WD repeat protein 35,WD40/YVTN repeat-like-containing [Cinara cedri]